MRLPSLLLLVLFAPAALALDPDRAISQYAHSMWTLQEGLLPGAPTAMAQTADGYLWIGTRTGLVRFDGVRFVPFPQTLRSNRILSLWGSRDGSLWIGTRVGLHRYREGQLIYYADAPSWAASIVEDPAGKIWFTRSALQDDKGPLCEVQGDRAVCHGAAAGVPIPNARQIVTDAAGNLWTVSDNALMRWRKGAAQVWYPPGIATAEVIDVVQSVVPAPDGSVWVGAMQPSRGLGLLRLVGDRLQSFVIPGLDGRRISVSQMWIDRGNALWIGTQDEGLIRLHDGKVSRYRATDGLSSDTVQTLFEDREGTIWVLTTRGIDAFRDVRVTSISSREGLSADLANAVLVSRDGTAWINTWHSLDAFRGGKVSALSARNGLPGEEVFSLFEDRGGTLWVGVDDALHVLEGGKFTPIRHRDGRSMGFIRGITEDAAGDVWALTPDTLARIRDRKVLEEKPRTEIPFVYGTLAPDPREGIWLALRNGDLARYRGGQLESFPFHREPGTGLINDLVAYEDGTIVGSTPLGLIGWRDGRTQTMTAANGLPCEDIYTVLKDRSGALWLYAVCGVIFVAADQVQAWWKNAAASLKFRVFDALDGAQPARGAFFPRGSVGPDGRLWFANASVVQVVDPARLGGNTLPPPVHIEHVTADRTSHAVRDGLRLPPNTSDLQIDYTGLSFVIPRKTQFRYLLEGHDRDWHEAGTRRQAFYTDLPPGDYRFRVTASNNDGVWNEEGTNVRFSIAPTFYQTRTFAVLCIAAAIGAVWLLMMMRVRQVETRMRMRLEERLIERERIARDLHDTLLQGLLSASMQLSVANTQIPQDAEAKPLVEKILRLLRQVVDEGRNTLRGLRHRSTEPEALELAFAQIPQDMVVEEKAEYRLIVEGTPRVLQQAVREEVYRIGREALANAFRHSGASLVETVLEYGRKRFRLIVRDNGCGMDPQIVQSGREGHWGLSGMRERSEKIGAQLKVLSAAGAGTEIELVVPGKAAFGAKR